MVCKKCGTLLSDTDNFCKKCGEMVQIPNGSQNKDTLNQQVETSKIIQSDFEKVETQSINKISNYNETLDENKKGNCWAIISLILFFIAPGLLKMVDFLPKEFSSYISSIAGLCPMIAIVIVVIGRVKYSQNKLLRAVTCLLIVLGILWTILIILFMTFWYITCSGVDTSGCN